MYQALYRKYRPKTLEDVCGQDVIVKIIKNSILNNKINHAYLFTGPRGTGKTSIAKIFAKMVNCEKLKDGIPCEKCVSCMQTNNSDIIEIDAASNNGVDEIRELRNKVNLVPAYGKYKVYIIDEVHMLTTGAFNALLKTLEEPPEHIIFILATTDPYKIPETILSRCQRFDFQKIGDSSIVKRLKKISQKEKIQIEEEALYEIARLSDGGMRDSIGMLDQANSYTDQKITADDIHNINGTLTTKDLYEFIEILIDKNIGQILKKIDFYNDKGKNIIKFTEELINYIRNILISKQAPDYFKEKNKDSKLYAQLAQKIQTEDLLKYIEILNDSLNKMKNTTNYKLLLEIAIIQILAETNVKKSNQKKLAEREKEEKIEIKKKNKELNKKEKLNSEPFKDQKKKIDNEKLQELKEIRINNTLAEFKKTEVLKTKEKLNNLNNYLLDPDYSKYASIVLDGVLKAASKQSLIFVYSNEKLANLFNENIINIEKTINKVLDNKCKVIATDIDAWEIIKNEFNSKKKKYNYKEEKIKTEEIFKETEEKNKFNDFEDIIEYN